MPEFTTRRTFTIGAATALALPLAGCLGGDDDGDGNGGDGDGSDGNGGDGDDGNGNDGNGGDDTGNGDGGSTDDGDEDEFELGEEYDLTVHFETGDGRAVSEGLFVSLDGNGQNWQFTDAEVVDGTLNASAAILREGEYALTVEGEEFGTVEEEFTLDEDTELTVTLEGAIADEDREDEGDGDDA